MSGQAAAEQGMAMSARKAWSFRLPVWRSKADKLAQALGDYVVEAGRVHVTPRIRLNSWGVLLEARRHRSEPTFMQRDGRGRLHVEVVVQIGPMIIPVNFAGSYAHRNFSGSEATMQDEHATQAQPSGSGRLSNASTLRLAGATKTAGQSPHAIPLISAASKMPVLKFPTGRIP